MKKLPSLSKPLVSIVVLCSILFAGSMLYAGKPGRNVSVKRHPKYSREHKAGYRKFFPDLNLFTA